MEHNLNQTPPSLSPPSKDHESDGSFSRLALTSIRTNGGTQTRAAIDQGVVTDYAEAIKNGETFPPVIVYYDGASYWLADGFHRHDATVIAGMGVINAEVRQGSQRDAILHSVGANAEHGFRRNNDDKRRAVQTLLADDKWSAWSDGEIARRCHVSDRFVAKQRKLTPNVRSENGPAPMTERRFTTRHGTEASMQTANIGSTKAGTRSITRTIDAEFQADPEFMATAREAALEQEEEYRERVGLSGAAEIEVENERLKKQIAGLDRRIATLNDEVRSLTKKADYFKREAEARGWTRSMREVAHA